MSDHLHLEVKVNDLQWTSTKTSWPLSTTNDHRRSLVATNIHNWSLLITCIPNWSFKPLLITDNRKWSFLTVDYHKWSLVISYYNYHWLYNNLYSQKHLIIDWMTSLSFNGKRCHTFKNINIVSFLKIYLKINGILQLWFNRIYTWSICTTENIQSAKMIHLAKSCKFL